MGIDGPGAKGQTMRDVLAEAVAVIETAQCIHKGAAARDQNKATVGTFSRGGAWECESKPAVQTRTKVWQIVETAAHLDNSDPRHDFSPFRRPVSLRRRRKQRARWPGLVPGRGTPRGRAGRPFGLREHPG